MACDYKRSILEGPSFFARTSNRGINSAAGAGGAIRMTRGLRFTLALYALASFSAQPAKADAVVDFYKGRTVTVVVSSSAAGGYDTIARAVARHMGKHMPGNPLFIVRNMPGAGGI